MRRAYSTEHWKRPGERHAGDVTLNIGRTVRCSEPTKIGAFYRSVPASDLLDQLASGAQRFEPSLVVNDCRNPADCKYLELALTAESQTIVPGDQDLLWHLRSAASRLVRAIAASLASGRTHNEMHCSVDFIRPMGKDEPSQILSALRGEYACSGHSRSDRDLQIKLPIYSDRPMRLHVKPGIAGWRGELSVWSLDRGGDPLLTDRGKRTVDQTSRGAA